MFDMQVEVCRRILNIHDSVPSIKVYDIPWGMWDNLQKYSNTPLYLLMMLGTNQHDESSTKQTAIICYEMSTVVNVYRIK